MRVIKAFALGKTVAVIGSVTSGAKGPLILDLGRRCSVREIEETTVAKKVSTGFWNSPAAGRVLWKGLWKFRAVGVMAFVGALVAAMWGIQSIAISPAFANSFDKGELCSSRYRISKSSATCLSAWWDNSPPYQFGDWGYSSKGGGQNHCSQYGEVGANIDAVSTTDRHLHLTNSSKMRYHDTFQTRDIECCINESDLCYKDQVEKHTSGQHEGKIRRVIVESSGYRTAWWNVSDFNQRYSLCKLYPDNIYCKNDPEGDAQTIVLEDTPISELRARECGGEDQLMCTCGDRFCDYGDCKWHWDRSAAAKSGSCSVTRSGTGVTMPADVTGNCRVVAWCDYGYVTYSGHPADLDDLVLCNNKTELKKDSCD